MTVPVELVLLRGLLPDIGLKPGTIVHGRVVDPRTLLLEGARLAAQLPEDVNPGDVLRLRVEEASTERLHLRVVERPEAQAAQAPPPPAADVPLPGGAHARLFVEEEESGAGGERCVRALTLRYDSPRLGRLDIRIEPEAVAVHVAAGDPAARVRDAAPKLRAALADALGHPAQVTVHPRSQAVSVRA